MESGLFMLFAVHLLISTLTYQRLRRQGSHRRDCGQLNYCKLEMSTVKTDPCKCLAFSVSLQGRFSE